MPGLSYKRHSEAMNSADFVIRKLTEFNFSFLWLVAVRDEFLFHTVIEYVSVCIMV